MPGCSRGWMRRCGAATSAARRCRCLCGGAGHGRLTSPQLSLLIGPPPRPGSITVTAETYREALEFLLRGRRRRPD